MGHQALARKENNSTRTIPDKNLRIQVNGFGKEKSDHGRIKIKARRNPNPNNCDYCLKQPLPPNLRRYASPLEEGMHKQQNQSNEGE